MSGTGEAAPETGLPWPPWLEGLTDRQAVRAIVSAVSECYSGSHDWRGSAEKWRDRYHVAVRAFCAAQPAEEPGAPQPDAQPPAGHASLHETAGAAAAPAAPAAAPGGGYFAEISFFGRIEHVGYVTEVTLHGGQPAYHIDLPEKLWGGNPLAWREYAASALFEKNPVTGESVRKAWEAERERAEKWRLQQAEWEQRQSRAALPAGDGGQVATQPDGDPDPWTREAGDDDDPRPF